MSNWYREECRQLERMAAVYRKHGKLRQAENSYRLIIALHEKNDEWATLDLAIAYYNLADLLCELNHYDKASPLFKKAVAIYQRTDADSSDHILWYSDSLARLQALAVDAETGDDERREMKA